jgi:hypothetical protein
MKNQDNFEDRKQSRRNKIKKENVKKHFFDDEDVRKHNVKKEIKKIKESFEDEEWEDWDKYYNH